MVQTPQFWENESLDALESVRKELHETVHLLKEQRQNKKFVIDIEDEYTTSKAPVNVVIQTTYKQRVIDYLAENSNNETLRKIQTLSSSPLPIYKSWSASSSRSWAPRMSTTHSPRDIHTRIM
ncbi:hypothetical protein [Leyella stercorea]|uniref:hypothetical protein n=1 Tax=Leyella stercorea TaxID=363265 RepID=UPI00242F4058|nr:hypothetical protein [Leyella stercorea]